MEPITTYLRTVLLASVLLFSAGLQAQQNSEPFMLRKGAIRSTGTLSPGVLLKSEDGVNLYLHGNFDFFLGEHFSLRGDGFYYLSTTGEFNTFKKHHQLYSGFSFHDKPKGFSRYAGLLMGVAITQINNRGIVYTPDATRVCPVISPHVGVNIYGEKYFHLFGEVRYIAGTYFPEHSAAVSLGEVRFSFGLGWNINTMKKR